ncbi:polysaccharide biosynthesis/export family protein [Allorhodopirellula heiligendammensis]|uniref:Polysaccharide biosynthesis/export protein n=1 Tax=Allorhodopirellula heiligendammensis TaxID=2714739 RepID=A0A5C6BUI1_9BACT|nr:polysaccharide biosynthesis/export family protein [Allorhodopirellula heiligendammensis]TWU15920.1 Polysaccharide biosynthesis/export protein [Allorhodopirellula heiligendammensis]|tara:strand:- start:38 stop:1381 length:1344 start_codon:yes stop_codon:yes gene_type:complete
MNTTVFQSPVGRLFRSAIGCSLAVAVATSLTGCTSLTQPINGIPANRLSPEFFPPPKNDLVPVDIAILSREPPRDYQIGPDDILGVYIEGVLPFNAPNAPPQPPPVNFPAENSTLPPSIGYPIAVQNDGTLALPLIEPLKVSGLTLDQVREKIRQVYIKEEILREEKARPIVTLIKERTFDVIVVREDAIGGGSRGGDATILGSDRSASGGLVKLPAYQNDVLHALVETGGLPGLTAKNEVLVLRASEADKRKRADFLREYWAAQRAAEVDPCYCAPELPDDPSILRIPLRVSPGVIPNISEEDITLQDGDIVYIESRETEVFYTGGLLPGGQHLLPRDYDLDVLGAMALAGQGIGSEARGGGGGGIGGLRSMGVAPGMLYVLRNTPCKGQVAIEVDLAKAINDPRSRPLVQPGDTLILQYKCEEEVINFGLGTFFTYGIRELFNNR